ncbi:unnamed protein product [Plutella xylostella]|uniref:(diamondback moth) hypothetical protein n=1 Tax=Plutella xylostella TaxID=51655 RepID=A0A8S4D4L7_PLUXY|nr:unnamed protein product [Plutella xylostella]
MSCYLAPATSFTPQGGSPSNLPHYNAEAAAAFARLIHDSLKSKLGYVRAALLPAATNAEAAAAFARLIHDSLKSKFTPINFFLHNLAQLRAGDAGAQPAELLAFMPRVYTMAQEGRLETVECLGYEKRYDPEKHYVYSLRVTRKGHATPAILYRSYRHFTELYQKICLHFPLAKVHR